MTEADSKPKYSEQEHHFIKIGFEFIGRGSPYDIYAKGNQRLFYCMPCRILTYVVDGKMVNKFRPYPNEVPRFLNQIKLSIND